MSWRRLNSLNYECGQNKSFNPFFHVENLKPLGRGNNLSTHAVHIGTIKYFDNCPWLCNYTFKNFIFSYHKSLGGPWPTLLSQPCTVVARWCNVYYFIHNKTIMKWCIKYWWTMLEENAKNILISEFTANHHLFNVGAK